MEKKELQEMRMKGYFIEATKQMLKGEGLKSLSVRSIADRAGYSFATLYNYFRDVKDLIFECVKDFQEECQEAVLADTEKASRGPEKIKAITRSYIAYFVQYPGIFDLFFIEKMTDLSSKQPTSELICNFSGKLTEAEWEYCFEKRIFSREEINRKKDSLKFLSSGILLLYLNRRCPADYTEFIKKLDEQMEALMQN